MKINWKQKLSSRKFWALLAALAIAALSSILDPAAVTQVVSIIGAFGAIMVYILAEAATDSVDRTAAVKK